MLTGIIWAEIRELKRGILATSIYVLLRIISTAKAIQKKTAG